MKFKKEFIQGLVNYLASKPYAEVYQFIAVISEELQKELGVPPVLDGQDNQQEKPDA